MQERGIKECGGDATVFQSGQGRQHQEDEIGAKT